MRFITLQGQGLGSTYAGDSAADDYGCLVYFQFGFLEWLHESDLGDGHPDKIFRFFRGQVRIILMDPGVLVSNVTHFKQVFIQPGIDQRFLEKGFVGFWRTCRHDDPVQIMLLNNLGHGLLRVLGARIKIVRKVFHIGECRSILTHGRDVHDAGDIDTTPADEHTDSWSFTEDIRFGNDFRCLRLGVPGQAQGSTGAGRCCTGIDNGLGNILGSLEGTTYIDAFARCFNRFKRFGFTKITLCQFDTQVLGQSNGFRIYLKPDGKYDLVKGFGLQASRLRNITYGKIIGPMYRVDGVDPAADKSHTTFFGFVVKALKVLSVGAHVHVKNRALEIVSTVFFGNYGFLNSIHAADR